MAAVQETVDRVRQIDVDQYRYGFETLIESDKAPKGLSEDIVRFISAKKNEPEWMLDWRLEAYRRWLTMTEPKWAKVKYPKIDFQDIVYEKADGIARVTINRPHRRNAISGRMLGELTVALRAAGDDPKVRCVILTGAGQGFCSGLDIKDTLAGTGIGSDPDAVGEAGSEIENLPTVVLQELDVPVIGVINGAAAGYGLDLALGCDIRLATASAKLNPGFARRGILPESGGTWLLPRIIG